MPFIEDPKGAAFFDRTIGLDQMPEVEGTTTFKERLGAAYRLENTLGSMLNQQDNLPDGAKATDFDVWSNLTDEERLDSAFIDNVLYADNMDELDAVRKQREREMRDRRMLEEGSLLESLIVSVADPVNMIPVGGTAYTSYRTGASILTNAFATATAAAAATGITEAELHRTQLTRTYGESAANITAATFLGGILGATPGTIARLFSKEDLAAVERSMNPEATIREGGNSVLTDASISAAKVDQDAQIRGKLAKAVANALAFDPLTRTITSENASTRATVNALAENPLDMDAPLRTSVESAIKAHDGKYFEAIEGHTAAYKAYKEAGGTMKYRDFNEAVGSAMRNGSEDPNIQAAAESWRTKLYDPIKQEAVDQGLLPEDVDVDTAEEYLNRVWNKEKLAAQMPEFIQTTRQWLDEQNAANASIKDEVATLYEGIQSAQGVTTKSQRSLDLAERRAATLEKQLSEIQREQKAGIQRQVKLEDPAIAKAITEQRKIDEIARKAMADDFQKYQDGQIASLEKSRDKAIREIEKEIAQVSKSTKIGKQLGEYGGLNREAWEAEGVDPAFFTDKTIKGGFGKPVFRKDGGLTPDDLAEKLWEDGILDVKDANAAVDYVDNYLRFGDDFVDPEVRQNIDYLNQSIDELRLASDADIESIYFGKPAGEPAPAGGAPTPTGDVRPTTTPISKYTERELRVAYTRLNNRGKVLRDQLAAQKDKARLAGERMEVTGAKFAEDVARLEELVAQWKGKTGRAVSRAMAARGEEAVAKFTKDLDSAAKKIIARDLDVDTEDLAREIAGRILGTPDGRLPYDYKIGQKSAGFAGDADKLAGPFKERSFKIPDTLVEPFLENDIETLGARYLKQTAPDIELTKRFGDVEMKAEIKKIEQDYDFLMQEAKTEKERLKLAKQREADIRDISAMRDRIRGIYNVSDPNNIWVRMQRVARDLNYMRLLGGVVAASIPDVARVVGAEGIAKTFSKGLKPLVTNLSTFKMAAREAKLYGVGIDALMNGRAEVIADVADYAKGGTAFERGVRAAANKFSQINLMNHWTSGIKQLHAVTVQTRIGDELAKGKYDKRLGQLGITEADAKNIAGELARHGRKQDGVWIWNTKDWDSQDLAMMWGAALRKESDRVIIMPGQEKPLFMSTEAGKTIFQFKTFMFSATQRILLSSLQAQDKHFIQGLIGMVSMGMLSYAFKQWDARRPISDDPKAWIAEGIDRSGVLGILMEMNNTMEKISSNTYGLRPMLGVSAPASRYASRTALDSAVGPTFGLAGDLIDIMGAATNQREWSEADTRALRRLLPGQNLSILRQGLDEIEKVIAD